jgi:hypothetical protein
VDAFLYRQCFPHRIGSLASIKAGLWYRSNSSDGQGSGSVSAEKQLMFERLKQALVESFVGAVALGYLLAQSISYLVNIFTTPVSSWELRNEYGEFAARSMTKGFSFKDALPGVLGFHPGSNPETASS